MLSLTENHIILIFLFLTCSVTFSAAWLYHPVGADVVFHLEVASMYLNGQNGMFLVRGNGMPYPPLFHLLMLPSLAGGFVDLYLRVVQALLLPSVMFGVLMVERRFGLGKTQMFLTGLALLGSNAFVDLSFQVRPESVDALLWVLIVWFLLSGKVKSGLACTVLGVYTHGFASLSYNGGVLLATRSRRKILAVALCSLPIVAISLVYLVPFLTTWFLYPAAPQAYQFLHNPFWFTLWYLGSLCLALPVAAVKFCNWWMQSELNKMCLWTLLSSLLMLPIWYDRFYAYASLPLAILLGDTLAKHRLYRIGFASLLVAFAFANYGLMWMNNIYGGWDVH